MFTFNKLIQDIYLNIPLQLRVWRIDLFVQVTQEFDVFGYDMFID